MTALRTGGLVVSLALICAACVQSLSHHAMSAYQPSWVPQKAYIGTIKVGNITAKENRRVFEKTVEQSLSDHQLLATETARAQYELDVDFVKIDSVDTDKNTIKVYAEIAYSLRKIGSKVSVLGDRIVVSESKENPTGTTLAKTRSNIVALAVIGGGTAISSNAGSDPAAPQFHRTLREFSVRSALEKMVARFMVDPK